MNSSANCLLVSGVLPRESFIDSMVLRPPTERIGDYTESIESCRLEVPVETESAENCDYSVWDCF